jgi:hypothetical protein
VTTLDATAAELAEIARRLREAGEGGLRREMTAAIKRAADGVPPQIRERMPDYLPDRYAGTLNADLATGVSVRTAGPDPSVAVYGRVRSWRRRRLRRIDDGFLAHPLFGDRQHWFLQRVTPGWFTGPAEDAAPAVRAEIERALDGVKDQIWRGI